MDNNPQLIKTNKLANVVNMSLNLDELNDIDNLEDGTPQQHLIYMPDSENFMHFKPQTPRYKKLKYGEIVSLTL